MAAERRNAQAMFRYGDLEPADQDRQPGPDLPEVPAHAQGGQAQWLASLGIPVVLTLNGLVDRLVVARHVLRIGGASELLKDVQTSGIFAVRSPRRTSP